ncbi:MAG: hypothetical protein HY770_05505, partial [Chitinivibrionia bacterium]|nr:hypothetical protein [Chitinivibrionia bacterium]
CMGNVPAPANVTATDNCDGSIKPVFVEVDDGKTCPKLITRTWTASDACGNQVSCSQKITVHDTTDPVLSGCPDDNNYQCYKDVPAPAVVTATDNCDGSLAVTFVEKQSNPGSSCDNTITRTWTAVDACGNDAICAQTIYVNDDTDPTITCPDDMKIDCAATPEFGEPTAEDNCDPDPEIIIVSTITLPGTTPGSYTTTRTWKAVDECGNESVECDQVITVECPDEFCSFTQGWYGNYGGKFNGETTYAMIKRLLSAPFGSLVVGINGRSLTIPYAAAHCLLGRLPAGGTPTSLPNIGNDSLDPVWCVNFSVNQLPLNSQGRWVNSLLAQTVTLSLNVRYDTDLPGFELAETFCTQAALAGIDGLFGTEDDVVNPLASIQHFSILSSVLTALDDLGYDRTVEGLLMLANLALGTP